MKFEYDGERKEDPVAILHDSGCLIVEFKSGCIAFGGASSDSGSFHEQKKLSFWSGKEKKKFYPGDKITITF